MSELEPTRTYSNLTATEVLRRMLDERGVEHDSGEVSDQIWWKDSTGRVYFAKGEKTLMFFNLTPEQAVAATLGRGMLTADDVRDLIERHSDASGGNGRDFHNGAYVAIADELNATLGSCNCPNNCTDSERTETCKLDDFADVPFSVDYEIEGYDMDSGRDYATLAECSACGAYIIVPPEYHHVLTCDGDEVYQPYRFCPNCGRRIEQ